MRLSTLTNILLGAVMVTASTKLRRQRPATAADRQLDLVAEIKNNNLTGVPGNVAGTAAGGPKGGKMENVCNVNGAIVPKVFIISMFRPEGQVWYNEGILPGGIGNLLAKNITLPGLSLVYKDVHCLEDCSVCQFTTGESEINAATSMTALLLAKQFNLEKTYFLIAGIAGISPRAGTIADVAFAKYAVQVALQYEFDARDMPSDFNTGYLPQGTQNHGIYPQTIFGTEVFELNESLRDLAVGFASTTKLADTQISKDYRKNYKAPSPNIYEAATREPKVIKCDVATSDVYFSGTHLGEAFDNTTRLYTNGSGIPCMTAQEDNATLQAMIRFAVHQVIDFSRIIVMRSAADFDRPYPGLACIDNLFYTNQGSFASSIANLHLAGTPVVKGILQNWAKFEKGIVASNYIGDIFGSLGGKPDFGPGPDWKQKNPVTAFEKRGLEDIENLSRQHVYRRHEIRGQEGAEIARRANGNA